MVCYYLFCFDTVFSFAVAVAADVDDNDDGDDDVAIDTLLCCCCRPKVMSSTNQNVLQRESQRESNPS